MGRARENIKNKGNGLLDDISPATSFHNQATLEKVLRDALNTPEGRKKIKEVIRRSNKKNNLSVKIDIHNISPDLGYGFKYGNNKIQKVNYPLTNIKIILQPDNKGSFYIKTAYPY